MNINVTTSKRYHLGTHVVRTLAGVTMLGTLAGSAWLGTAIGHAAPQGADAYAYENTVLLSEIDDEVNSIPVCVQEDGSDVIPAIAGRCVWFNDGAAWLTYEDRSYRIIMDIDTLVLYP